MFWPHGNPPPQPKLIELCAEYFRQNISGSTFLEKLRGSPEIAHLAHLFDGIPERTWPHSELWLPDDWDEDPSAQISGPDGPPLYEIHPELPWPWILPCIKQHMVGRAYDYIWDLTYDALKTCGGLGPNDLQEIISLMEDIRKTDFPWEHYFPRVPSSFCGHGGW